MSKKIHLSYHFYFRFAINFNSLLRPEAMRFKDNLHFRFRGARVKPFYLGIAEFTLRRGSQPCTLRQNIFPSEIRYTWIKMRLWGCFYSNKKMRRQRGTLLLSTAIYGFVFICKMQLEILRIVWQQLLPILYNYFEILL